jgi:hypothetical protein
MQQLFTFRPSLLMQSLMHFATPHNSKNGEDGDFKVDAAWFKAHKPRNQVIRKASFAEFNTFDTWQQCGRLGLPQPPQLWSLVMRSGASNHIIIPIYLGDSCFPTDNSVQRYDTCETDDALQVILHHINHNKGFDSLEFLEFIHKTKLAVQAATVAKQIAGQIN